MEKLNWETAPYAKKGKAAVADFNGKRFYVKWSISGFVTSVNGKFTGRKGTMEEAKALLEDLAKREC